MSTKPSAKALMIDTKDNVATTLEPIEPNTPIDIATPTGTITITPTEPIPLCHKIALQPLSAGTPVIKYGEPIGTMLNDTQQGALIHTHNMKSLRC